MMKIPKGSVKYSVIALMLAVCGTTLQAQISFEEVTSSAGDFHVGESWGSSWGDINGDARLDLFVSNHRERASIYRNNGDGTFTDIVLTVDQSNTWLNLPLGDTHGGTWTDFDADGDQDLIISTGTQIPPHLFVNENGVFIDRTTELGIPDDGGGRMTAVFDYDDDSRIDFAIMNSGTSMILRQLPAGDFVKVNNGVDFDCNGFRSNYAQLADINNDISLGGDLEFFCMRDGTSPAKVFDTSTSPFTDITATVPDAANVVDTVIADFDRNLLPDMLLVRGSMRPSQVLEVSPQQIEASVVVGNAIAEKEFYFQTTGVLDVDIDTRSFGVFKVFIGAGGGHPSSFNFTLDPSDQDTWGLMPHDPLVSNGLYIGYDTTLQEWRFQLASGNVNNNIYAVIHSDAPVSGLTLDGLGDSEFPIEPVLFLNNAGILADKTNQSGELNQPLSCVHAIAADIDNDMDEDIYFVCRDGVENIENRLFVNQGDGSFIELPGAGGAQGVVGAGLDSGAGIGESVTFADYDMDGHLDLLVLNGLNLQPLRVGGPNQLFRNLGNSNHWIQLDLVGTASNIDAVGAKVYADTPGITQMRERNGSYHRWSHDMQRIHFGLGSNTSVDLRVFWPNGDEDFFEGMAADQIYRITQDPAESGNGTIEPVIFGPVPGLPSAQPGDECGEPVFDAKLDRVLLIWKNCDNDSWHIRASAGGDPMTTTYNGSIFSDQGFIDVEGIELENSDIVDNTTNSNVIDFTLKMANGGRDGIDFSFPSGAGVCFDMSGIPAGAQILIGAKRFTLPLPLDLQTMVPCINISIDDVTVDEGAGTADFTVSLSAQSSNQVTVNYTTLSGSATEDVDYAKTEGLLIFDPGETMKPVSVPISQDDEGEGTEQYTVELSAAINASIAEGIGTGTIIDDDVSACGAPSYYPGTDQGVFIWKDCGWTEQWFVRTTGGGSQTKVSYEGSVTSDLGFDQPVAPFSVEPSDTLDNTTDPSRIDFVFGMRNSGQDGFNFSYPSGSTACFDVTLLPQNVKVQVGSTGAEVSTPFELGTLGPCLGLSIDDVTVDEGAGTADFTVSLSAQSSNQVTVNYTTVSGSATEDVDYAKTEGLLIFDPGETMKPVSVPISQDDEGEGTEQYTVELSAANNASIADGIGIGTINDDDVSACGAPSYDPGTDQGVFIWKDCGGTEQWFVRTTAGGSSTKVSYEGSVTSDLGFDQPVAPFSVEASDTLDNTTNPNRIDYVFGMRNSGQDGFIFSYPSGSIVCFDAGQLLPPGVDKVIVGANNTEMNPSFDLETMEDCQ